MTYLRKNLTPKNQQRKRDEMKNILLVVLVISLCSCQMIKNAGRQIVSSTTGISRAITVYSNDGHIIRTWTTKSSINDEGSVICFYDSEGNAIQVSGTVIVEQLK